MLEAKDLPTNNLSNLLEAKVAAALAADRQQRAAMQVGGRCAGIASLHGLSGLVVVLQRCVARCCSVCPDLLSCLG